MNIELHLLLMPVAGLILFLFIKVFAPLAEARRLIESMPAQRGQLDVWVSMMGAKRCNINVSDESGQELKTSAKCVSASKANFQYKGLAEFYFHPDNNRIAVKAADCVLLLSIV